MNPTARLLDITRLSSRIGRVLTGVDRVELAYLRAVHKDPIPDFAIARTALGYVLLDHNGIGALLQRLDRGVFPRPDLVSRLNRRLSDSAKMGQTLLRSLAVRRCTRGKLPAMLARHMPDGYAYLNVGHSNLTDAMLSAVKAQVTVMIHDTIPLDYPQYQRSGTVDQFAAKLRRVGVYADLVLGVSQAGLDDVARHLAEFGNKPNLAFAHLGTDPVIGGTIPADIPLDRPYFVTTGTIEPRKNHALLLDLWERLGADAPRLFICGARGWENDAVFQRLDAGLANVHEFPGLSDGDLAALTQGARASLFPTFAEGFGLPPIESLALGTPVLCSDLPVLRETVGDHATFADPRDVSQWEMYLKRFSDANGTQGEIKFDPSTWDAHFNTVFTMT